MKEIKLFLALSLFGAATIPQNAAPYDLRRLGLKPINTIDKIRAEARKEKQAAQKAKKNRSTKSKNKLNK